MILQVLIVTIGVAVFSFLEGLVDGYAILNRTYSRRQRLSHTYNWLSRSLAVGAAVLLFSGLSMLIYAAGVFWIGFELTINWKLNRSYTAVGHTAWTDKAIRKVAAIIRVKPIALLRIKKPVQLSPSALKMVLQASFLLVSLSLIKLF